MDQRPRKCRRHSGVPTNASIYKYPNTQEAAPIWFHDHVLGVTRLDVYAGLAGAYFIQDPALNLPPNLQPLTEVMPVVIQDRMFDTNGQLFFPADSANNILWTPNPEHPYWVPEFVGDTIVVNGKAWPYLSVMPKRYRFLFLNGSNARTYEMFIEDPVTKYTGVYNAAFPTKLFQPAYGPPLDYNTGNSRALGGNPDITPWLQGPLRLPLPQEQGWKDTVIMYPGQVTRIAVRWAPTDLPTNTPPEKLYFPFDPSDGLQHGYVWHCHIIDHEDNEMMRPDVVQLNPAAPAPADRPLVKGRNY